MREVFIRDVSLAARALCMQHLLSFAAGFGSVGVEKRCKSHGILDLYGNVWG